jgi:hypothetical protein
MIPIDGAGVHTSNGQISSFTPIAICIGTLDVMLPKRMHNKYPLVVKNAGVGQVTLLAYGNQRVEGGSFQVLAPGESISVVYLHNTWYIV